MNISFSQIPLCLLLILLIGSYKVYTWEEVTEDEYAPPPPVNVDLQAQWKGVSCSWSFPSKENYSCHETTTISIMTLARNVSVDLPSTKESFPLNLTACDVGEINCTVAFRGGTNGTSASAFNSTDFTDEFAGTLVSSLDILPHPETLEISWSLEDENCSRIGGYRILVSGEGLFVNATFNDTTPHNITVKDLVPCTSYVVEVQPLAVDGSGDLARPCNDSSKTNSSAPGPTSEVFCEEPSTGYEFNVSWSPPLRNNCVRSYSLNYTGSVLWSEETTQAENVSSSSPFQLQGLIPWTFYNVCVAGVTEDGSEGAYNCCTTTTAQEAPGPPENFGANVMGPSTVEFSWDAPIEKNGNLTGYRISWDNGSRSVTTSEYQATLSNLASETSYNFTIQAKTEEDNFGEGSSIDLTTAEEKDYAPAIVAGASVTVLVLIIAVLAFVYRLKLRNFRTKMVARIRGRSIYSTSTSSHNGHVMPPIERPFKSRQIPDTKPMKKDELRQYIADLELDSQKGLEEEFALLKSVSSSHPDEVSKAYYNKQKNRYANILPYDHTRVVLKGQDGVPGSDYINASYIEDISDKRTFIASQGPKDSTVPDFWKMIWELECFNIVMLTDLVERGRSHVKTKRKIRQFHFTAWPDYGAPKHEDQLLDFISFIRTQREVVGKPMVVHCSAGVGRTGTFIGAWNLIDLIRKEPSSPYIDIKREVLAMRECRPLMVQSQDQYLYLCKCIAAYLDEPKRWKMESDSVEPQSYDNDAYDEEPKTES
ncbi:receptor-type tyrosine-protein phosphatase alpha-like [Macrobrachium nipponense]|uniref:receptor-type tyrosine-protein phosphatase alpha-like n=1 Tax=Macrobrachium nipponense TaxID=159736 RepID=UPI0030C83460